jgi:RNA polymerase sigma-70 factor (ECF subfamily)
VLERAVILSSGPELELGSDALPGVVPLAPAQASTPAVGGRPEPPLPAGGSIDDLERRHIVDTLGATAWRVEGYGGAAERLGVNPSTLRSRMKKLGISRSRDAASQIREISRYPRGALTFRCSGLSLRSPKTFHRPPAGAAVRAHPLLWCPFAKTGGAVLKISRSDRDSTHTTLQLEGRVTHAEFSELERTHKESQKEGRRLVLDLTGVSFADREGVAALNRMRRDGIIITGCSPFVGELSQGELSMSAMTPTLAGFGSQPSPPRAHRRPVHMPQRRRERPAPPSAGEAAFDAWILPSLRAGDQQAYDLLVRANTARMLAVARRLLFSEEDARDAVQEAFLLAFRALPQFAGRCCLSTWLHRIVVNAALMKLRFRRRHPEEWIEEIPSDCPSDGMGLATHGSVDEPEDAKLERTELRQLVHRCILRLPQRFRTVLVLRDIQELSTEEACRVLRLSPAAIKTRLHRARKALQELLEKELPRCA